METIETLNKRLIEHFGTDVVLGLPIFRIVWANEQTEIRLVDITDSGIQLLEATIMEVKKYPYLKDLYVLERLVLIPDIDQPSLPASKLSYEPIWAYRGPDGLPIAPIWNATKFIIDTLYAALGKSTLKKYVDSEKNTTAEGKEQRIKEISDELFGDETETGDALRYREGIVVPSNYDSDKKVH